jgi:DNA invertase Pin-like site-specific DNA recombinase
MNSRGAKTTVRCAIYTRVSTDSGLDQDFNSLDAQFEASSAYVRSQSHEGWRLIRRRYDDGGFSGGSTDRPALQVLLDDVKNDRIDVVVVYKVDRLTRSLADFARLVDLFDKHGVSFVSVTQQFNTTSSMGRLTLNVLLSFAQFEREVTSERIRDKIAASKRKGLWVGGMAPLGYEAKDRKIKVVEREAKIVRYIFQRYLELGSINALLGDLRGNGFRTKRRQLSTGKMIGDIPFRRGTLAYLLRNRFYIGEVCYRNENLAGEQEPILDRKLFEAVQTKLDHQRITRTTARSISHALLSGRIFDDRGNRMTPTSKLKKGTRYRYYISAALSQGTPDQAGGISRAPAELIERLVYDAVSKQVGRSQPNKSNFTSGSNQGSRTSEADSNSDTADNMRLFLQNQVSRVDVLASTIKIRLAGMRPDYSKPDQSRALATKPIVLSIPWTKPPSKVARQLIPPTGSSRRYVNMRPMRAETRAKLVQAIATGRRFVENLIEGAAFSIEEIARRERCSARQVNLLISLAFLSSKLVSAAIEGRLPRGIGIANLRNLPPEWSKQHRMLGLAF